MAIEIERKFLVATDRWRPLVKRSQTLRQGYLSTGGSGVTVRVRTIDDARGYITIKSGGSALARAEFEYEVPITDARQLLALGRGARIEKTRHTLDLGGGDWVVDEFLGHHSGLVLAEVELDSPNAPLTLPDWLGDEVTGDPQYYNSSLAMLVGGEI
ncbi:CYTH domain-containing protein [Devosia sp. ZB163]|uniref:CYTH domain-containing protein n=1 Tax=Devosia sp. ZB163 TaxID=3025938 RepID=UPI002361387C|nr:CYTH domain-containing protein [Devosia sp. ZB163]MDC9824480.1 CYTH domain-containing protein [Devosia sp. ZB163]